MKYPCGTLEKLGRDKVPNIEAFINVLDEEYLGIAYVKILPPQDLNIPVLSLRNNYKSVLPLCFTCAVTGCQKFTRNENERSIEGVFTTEFQLARNIGYKILKIFEVGAFKEMEYLFEDYVNYFLKIKKEGSGIPEGIHENDPDIMEKLKEFVCLLKEKEGIELDINSNKRTLACVS